MVKGLAWRGHSCLYPWAPPAHRNSGKPAGSSGRDVAQALLAAAPRLISALVGLPSSSMLAKGFSRLPRPHSWGRLSRVYCVAGGEGFSRLPRPDSRDAGLACTLHFIITAANSAKPRETAPSDGVKKSYPIQTDRRNRLPHQCKRRACLVAQAVSTACFRFFSRLLTLTLAASLCSLVRSRSMRRVRKALDGSRRGWQECLRHILMPH